MSNDLSGSYVLDPKTGVRTLVERTFDPAFPHIQPPQPVAQTPAKAKPKAEKPEDKE